jgi:putative hemolysin
MNQEASTMSHRNSNRRFVAQVAASESEVLESLRLRYQIFAGELGARLKTASASIDVDHFDPYCQHLFVRDALSGRMVASTRVLTEAGARQAGGYYSQSEFDLGFLSRLPGRKMEVGRTCVDREFRNGIVIATLWAKLMECLMEDRHQYLFGCASIDLDDGGDYARSVMRHLNGHHFSPLNQRVRSLRPLPEGSPQDLDSQPRLPPLLKAYINLGAKICGEAYWDEAFNCADVFVLLNLAEMSPRYARRFERPAQETLLAGAA